MSPSSICSLILLNWYWLLVTQVPRFIGYLQKHCWHCRQKHGILKIMLSSRWTGSNAVWRNYCQSSCEGPYLKVWKSRNFTPTETTSDMLEPGILIQYLWSICWLARLTGKASGRGRSAGQRRICNGVSCHRLPIHEYTIHNLIMRCFDGSSVWFLYHNLLAFIVPRALYLLILVLSPVIFSNTSYSCN